MQMNPSTLSEILSEADGVKDHCGNPHVDTVPPEPSLVGRPPGQNPEAPHVEDEDACGTFAGGAGI
jgi:hypothetical protein